MNRKHTEFIENIRSMKRMIKTDMGSTDIDDKYYGKLEWWSEALISVIQEIDRKCEKTTPTIIEKAILDYIESRKNKRVTMSDIIDMCIPGDKEPTIVNFIEATVLQLECDNRISKMWYPADHVPTYEINR